MIRSLPRNARPALPILAMAAAAALLSAQVPPVGVAPATAPATIPATAPSTQPWLTVEPATTQPVVLPNPQASVIAPSTQPTTRPIAQKVKLEFKDAAVETILDYLSETFGFVVVKDKKIEGRVTVVSRDAVSAAEAVMLLNAVLKPNGLYALQQGRLLKIVDRGEVKKQNLPVMYGADPDQIPESDDLVTYVIPLKNVDAVKLRQDLQPLVSADADFTANQASNALILTETSANVRRLVKIVYNLDKAGAAVEMKIFPLTYANAASAAKLVTSVFGPDTNAQNQQSPGSMFRRMMMGGGGEGGGREGRGDRGGEGGSGSAGAGKSTGKVTAASDDRTNTVVVTAPSDTLKLVEELLKALDSNPAAVSVVKVFQLKFADSASAVKLINTIFQSDSSSSRQGGQSDFGGGPRFGGFGRGGGGFGGPEGGGGDTGRGGGSSDSTGGRTAHITAASDDRTNTVVVTAPADSMQIITGILAQLDSNPSAESAFFIYHLRNGQAADIQTDLNNLFSGNNSGSTAANNNNRNSGQSLIQSGLGSNSGFGSSGGFGGSSGGGRGGLGGSSGGGFGSALSGNGSSSGRTTGSATGSGAAGGAGRAYSEMVGQVYVVADVDTNSLLVSTASKYQEQVKKIIEELDRPVPQVLIKVLVAEVTRDKTNDFGIDFSVIDARASGKGVNAAQNLGNIAAQATNGGLVASLLEDNLTATLHALAVEGKLDVLSRPYILASDNQPASITIGQEVPFITNTQVNITGQQINTITYQAVGIILNVTPHINPDGIVTLDVAPEISQLTGTTVPIGAGISAPVIANRSAQSRVAIRNGNTIVIGGMMQDQKTTTLTKIPLLGDIPLIGQFFTRYQDDRSKTELLIFLTPHVALQPDTLKGQSEDEIRGAKVVPTAVDKGVYDEHMDGLKRGATVHDISTQPASTNITATPSTQPLSGITITPVPEPTKPAPTPPEPKP